MKVGAHQQPALGTEKVGMKFRTSTNPVARVRSEAAGKAPKDRSAWSGQGHDVSLGLGILSAAMLALSPAFAADRATCSMVSKLLEATDRGLEAAAAGDARGATSGIAVFAQQSRDMANRFSQNDPLPDAVTAALTAILDETSAQYFIAAAAPVLLAQALAIQQAMPNICPGSKTPDLSRHVD